MRLLLFFAAFLALSCSAPPNRIHTKVVEVVDGDTVRLADGQLLRYIGIDTPEIRIKEKSRFIYKPQPYSLQAREYNRELIEGKDVWIELDVTQRDRYGRILGYCFVDGIFVNAELLKAGLAVLYTRPPNVRYVEALISAQKQAQISQRGLWGAYEVVSSDDAHQYINQTRTVRGKIKGAWDSSRAVFLNFGADYKKDFTAVIFNDCLPFFKKEGISPAREYVGKTVEVTGRIREYNGPEIIVCMPYQINIIDEE